MKSSASRENMSANQPTNMSKSSATLERNMHKSSRESTSGGGHLNYNSDKESRHMGKTYGPWYDFWDQEDQGSIIGSKIK